MIPKEKRVLHCWADGPTTEDDCGTTCMLLKGHAAPHEWTRDDCIGIAFEGPKRKPPQRIKQ